MKNDMIWAYFMQLSTHMWDDENTPPRFKGVPAAYHENNEVDLRVWDMIVDFIAERQFNMAVIDVGDAIRYESHPEISAPDAWSKDFMKQKLDEMRKRGIEPIPKLNFSACHHTWLKQYRRMVSTPEYYRVCSDVIAEVAELFGNPRLFHLGMDEENYANQIWREAVTIRGEKLWWHDAYFFFDEVEKHGARPWVWSDYFWDHPDLFVKNMPKSVLQSNWFYYHYRDYDPKDYAYRGLHAFEKLNQLGYDQLPTCSSWNNSRNPMETLVNLKEIIDPALLKGYMTAPWVETTARDEFFLQNDAHLFYVARQRVYPETLK